MGQSRGMGLSLGFGADAGANSLMQLLAQKRLEQLQNIAQRDRDRDFELRRKTHDDTVARQTENDKYVREDRGALTDLRKQQRADRMSGVLVPGSAIDAETAAALRDGMLGSLVKREDSALPSRAMAGAVDTSGGAPRIVGAMRSQARPGHEARDIYQGTQTQQLAGRQRETMQELIDDPKTPDHVRQYLSVMSASPSRGSLPSTLFQSPDQPVFQLGADGTLRQSGTVPRGSRVTNAPRPPAVKLAPGSDNAQLPRGAQAYALQIAQKHGGDYNAALAEATNYVATQQDHPSLSPQKFMAAVKAAASRPTGATRIAGAPGARVFSGGGGQAPAASAGRGSAPSGGAGGTVLMVPPTGGEPKPVPADQVEHYKSLGAKVVGGR